MAVTIGGQEVRPGETLAQARARIGGTRNGRPSSIAGNKPEPTTTRSTDSSANRQSAAVISSLLREYGLEELVSQVDRWVRDGLSWPEVEARLMDPSTAPGKVVDRLYPELRERRDAGFAPVSIAQIQSYRTGLRQMVSARGMADAFPNIEETARAWIVGDKSLDEMNERLALLEGNVARQIAEDPTVQAELEAWERYYGVKPSLGNLVAMAINPEEATPALARRFAAVKFDVEAGRAGFGDLSVGEAEFLTDQGVDANQSGQGFGALVRSQELFSALDAGEDNIDRKTQLDAAFTNSEAAKRRIEQRAARRAAAFQGGGSVAGTRGSAFGGLSTSSDT